MCRHHENLPLPCFALLIAFVYIVYHMGAKIEGSPFLFVNQWDRKTDPVDSLVYKKEKTW
jgi:hypothetical protein